MGWFSRKPSEFDTMMQVLRSVPLDKWTLEQTQKGRVAIRFEEVIVYQDVESCKYDDGHGYLLARLRVKDEALIKNRAVPILLTRKQRSVVFQWLKDTVMRMSSLTLLEQLRKDESTSFSPNKMLGTIKT